MAWLSLYHCSFVGLFSTPSKLQVACFFFLKDLVSCLEGGVTERQSQLCHTRFTSQTTTMAGTGPGWVQEPGIPSWSTTWIQEPRTYPLPLSQVHQQEAALEVEQPGLYLRFKWYVSIAGSGSTHWTTTMVQVFAATVWLGLWRLCSIAGTPAHGNITKWELLLLFLFYRNLVKARKLRCSKGRSKTF